MNTILKDRVNEFLRCSGMSQSQFAKNVDLCSVTISQWLGDKRIISQKAEIRINDFMSDYVARITKVVNN